MRRIVISVIVATLLCLISFIAGKRTAISQMDTTTDTLVVTRIDTIRIEKPTYHKVITRDTILLAVADTIRVNDTTYVQLPVESKVYSDSLYTAQISGYEAELDWIEVYPVTKTVTVNNTLTNTVYKKARWGIGIQAGYGATLYNGKVQLSPYIGVGVSCNFIRW